MKPKGNKKARDYGADHAIDNVALSGEATGLIPAPPRGEEALEAYPQLADIVDQDAFRPDGEKK